MGEPWDRPPFPKRGNASQRVLFEFIGRALMAWEEVETALAHLYSIFSCGSKFDQAANREYGEPPNFAPRLRRLEERARGYFVAKPCQEQEGEFDNIIRLATAYAPRRNDIAHGVARPVQWVLDPNSHESLLSLAGEMQWCVIPPHFRDNKFTSENRPVYVLTSRETNRFSEAFWKITHRATKLATELDPPIFSSRDTSALL